MGSRRRVKAAIRTQTAVVCVQSVAQTVTIHRIGRDSRWEQFDTAHILIDAIHWVHRCCGALSWFDRLEKKPSVKADWAIYTHMLGVPRQYLSVAIMLSYKLDFSCCADMVGFPRPSHI